MEKEKEDVIAKLRERKIDFNPNAEVEDLKKLLSDKPETVNSSAVVTPSEEVGVGSRGTGPGLGVIPPKDPVLAAIAGLTKLIGSIDTRLAKVEGKESGEYRTGAKTEDIENATAMKDKIEDPKIIEIVETSLGTDFGVVVKQFDDKPGFLFTVIVPQRLSDNVADSRPIKDADGLYKKNGAGDVLFEDYFKEDRRSRAIGSMQSYDAIKKHCDQVRSYIVAYYQKSNQPLPEFKVK